MRENQIHGVVSRVERTFNDRLYIRNIERSKRSNWLNVSASEAFTKILVFLKSL